MIRLGLILAWATRLALGASMLPGAPAFAGDGKSIVQNDFRIVSAVLTITVGNSWLEDVSQARLAPGDVPAPVRILRGGDFTAADLRAQPWVTQTAEGLRIDDPIILWQDATLTIDGEQILFNRATGAFLLALGPLRITDSLITSTRYANIDAPKFRSFVVVAGSAHATLENVVFRNIGHRAGPPFGGFAVLNQTLFPARGPTSLRNVAFEGTGTPSLIGVKGARIEQLTVRRGHRSGLRLQGVRDVTLKHVRIEQVARHGVRITRAAQNVTIRDLRVNGAGEVGLFVDQGAHSIRVERLTTARTGTAGLIATDADCLRFDRLDIRHSAVSGVILDRVRATALTGAILADNRGAGLFLRNQPPDAAVHLQGLRFVGNQRGLDGAGLGGVRLQEIDLSANLPRMVQGDFARHIAPLLAQGALSVAPQPGAAEPCPRFDQGA